MHEGLYMLSVGSFVNQGCSDPILNNQISSVPKSQLYSLWHSRLGHASKNKLLHIYDLNICYDTSHLCYICSLAKQQKMCFHKCYISTEENFELIHLWGPYSIKSIYGATYILTIVDNLPFKRKK